MNPRVRIAIQRIEQAFESQNWDHPTLLMDAHEVAMYAKQAKVTIGGGDTAISQLEQEADCYRRERDALQNALSAAKTIARRFAVPGERHNPDKSSVAACSAIACMEVVQD